LNGEPCILVDTAGIRRKARIDERVERFSVARSLNSVDRGDLVIHVIDGIEGVTDQDAQILAYAVQRGKALLLVVNKWDVVSKAGGEVDKHREEVRYHLSFLDFAPIAFISAVTGFGGCAKIRDRDQSAARLSVYKFRPRRSTSLATDRARPYGAAAKNKPVRVLLWHPDRHAAAFTFS
jgi:small GTP-binding protein